MAARIFGEFKSDNEIEYVIEIHDTEFGGVGSSVKVGGDGFQINWNGETDEIYSPIIGSSATFSFYDKGEDHMADFINLFKQYQEDRFFVVIYREATARYVNNLPNVISNFETRVAADGGVVESICYRSDIVDLGGTFRYISPIAEQIYWYGWIIQDLIEVEDVSNPTLYQFQAVDGISKMKNTPYEYEGSLRTFTDHLYNFINENTPSSNLTSSLVMLRTVSNYWSEQQTHSETTDPLSITRFPTKTFAEYDDTGVVVYSNALDILREMCLVMGARFYFDEGCFRFEQFSSRDENELREFKYLMDGTSSTYDDVAVDFDVDQIAVARSSGSFRFLPAVNKIELTDTKKAHINIIGRAVSFPNNEIGVGIIPSVDNGRVILEMRSEIQTYISNALQSTATPVFGVTIRLEPSDGTADQYWKNSIIVNSLVFGTGSWSTVQDTFKWSGNTISRVTSSTTTTSNTMVTGPLPKDGDIFINISFLGFYNQGLDATFISAPNAFAWNVLLNKARFENDNSPASVASVTGLAINTSTKIKSNLTLDLGETRLFNGSGELGSLYVYNGAAWVPSGKWRVGNTGSYISTSSLVTSDLMQFHNAPIERWEGTMIYPENFKDLLRFDTHQWIAMSATLNANVDELSGEWFRISPDNTNITIGTPIDTTDTDVGGTDAADFVGRYSNVGSGSVAGMIVDIDNDAIGPYKETTTGGQINGTANVTGNTTLAGTLGVTGVSTLAATTVEEFTTTDRVNVTINEITANDGGSENLTYSKHFNLITYEGGNGTYTITLPESEPGVILRFKTDDTIAANKTITLQPQAGGIIDAESTYLLDRSFDGITLLGKGGDGNKWLIIQKKEK